MPADCRTPSEQMLHALGDALELHGLGRAVGLMLAETFPRHRGGIGIIVGFPDRERAAGRKAAAWLLRQMGCDWVRPDDAGVGVEAHLSGELLPCPPLPVRSADSCSVAEGAAVAEVTGKRCAGPCGAVLPVTEFIFLNRATGRRCSYCVTCERARQKRARAARQGVPVS